MPWAGEEGISARGSGVSTGPAAGRLRGIGMEGLKPKAGRPRFQSQLCLGL